MTLKNGDVGANVRDLQRQLNARGYKLEPDGWFGDETEKAVIDFQKKNNITAIGQAGPRTIDALRGINTNKHLTDKDLQAAAELLGVPVASVATVAQVESAGQGFNESGKPPILYERHVFYKQMIANGKPETEVKKLAERMPNIVNQKRGGYAGGINEYVRLSTAMLIDELSAIESCSWGMFQIMGYHWARLGYTDVHDFRMHMQESEGEQLQAFCKFILTDKTLLKALKDQNWPKFAELYNGSAYKENMYDMKLARAFEKLSAVYPMAIAA